MSEPMDGRRRPVTNWSPAIVPPAMHRAGAIAWRVLVVVGLLAIAVWLSFVLGTVTASILLALIVAATFAPLTRRLRAGGWSRVKAAAIVTAAAVFVAGVTITLVVLAFAPYADDVVAAVRAGMAELSAVLQDQSVSVDVTSTLEQASDTARAWIGAQIGALAGWVAAAVTIAILALFLTFYVLADGDNAWQRLLTATQEQHRGAVESSGWQALERVGGYLRGTAILAAIRAASVFVFTLLLGVPLAAPLAVLAFMGGFVPYVGPLIATVTVLLVALSSVGWQSTIILFVLLGITTLLQSQLLRPIIYGRSVALHPAVILVALPIAGYVAGIVGLFAALPVLAFVVAIGSTAIELLEPPPEDTDRVVSGWLDRLAQWSWRTLAVAGVVAVGVGLVAQVPLVVTPVIVAAVIAATVAPAAGVLERRGWSRSRAAGAVTASACAILLLVVLVAVGQLAGPMVSSVGASVDGASQANLVTSGALEWLVALAASIGATVAEAIVAVAEAVSSLAFILVLSPLLAFYLLRDGGRGWSFVTSRATPWRRNLLTNVGAESAQILGGYMLGTAAISAVGAISQLLIMLLLGLPFAVPVAVLSFIACFIPYIGGFVTTGIAFLIAVAYGEPPEIVIMFIYTIVFNLVQGNIVTPIAYSRAVRLHPAVVLLAIPAGGALAGIAGMFLVVPILAVVAAAWRSVVLMLGDEPASSPVALEDAGATRSAALVPEPSDSA